MQLAQRATVQASGSFPEFFVRQRLSAHETDTCGMSELARSLKKYHPFSSPVKTGSRAHSFLLMQIGSERSRFEKVSSICTRNKIYTQ